MCDAVTVLGSRHGLLIDPVSQECGIIKFSRFTDLPRFHIRAGLRIGGRRYMLPLCPEGGNLSFHDQRTTPCTLVLTGIHAESCLKIRLTLITPFRPRDPVFSTTPVLGFRLEVSRIPGQFRWDRKTIEDGTEFDIFLAFAGDGLQIEDSGPDCLDMLFQSQRIDWPLESGRKDFDYCTHPHRDRFVVTRGEKRGTCFVSSGVLADDVHAVIEGGWAAFEEAVLSVADSRCPFRYAGTYDGLDDVCDWIRANPTALFENAARVDSLIAANNCSSSVNHLLAYSLH